MPDIRCPHCGAPLTETKALIEAALRVAPRLVPCVPPRADKAWQLTAADKAMLRRLGISPE